MLPSALEYSWMPSNAADCLRMLPSALKCSRLPSNAAQRPWRWMVVGSREETKRRRRTRGKGDGRKVTGEWKCGSVWRIPTHVYPPLQAVTHQARRLVPTPRAQFTQALTKGPRSCPSVSTGRRSGDPTVQKQNIPHILHVRHPIGSGIMVMIALAPNDFCCAVTTHGELQCMTVLPDAPCVAASRTDRGPPCVR
jgi:hypothetical protein